VLGVAASRTLGDAFVRSPRGSLPGPVDAAVDADMEAMLWGRIDHVSTWDGAVAGLRDYAAEGGPDGDMLERLADVIDDELSRTDRSKLVGANAFFPAAVLMLHGVASIREYADRYEADDQVAFVRRLMEAV